MTTTTVPITGAVPTDPDAPATLFEVWSRIFNADVGTHDPEAEAFVAAHGGMYDVAAVIAVARAVCPEGYRVVPEPGESAIKAFFYAFREHITLDMCRQYLAADTMAMQAPHPDTVAAFSRVISALLNGKEIN
jgi:hypothetical protein